MTYDVGNPGPGLELARKCFGVKLVNVITVNKISNIFIYGRE
jgi:hypothetical protein